jgi:hypothetical protein
MLLYSFDSLPYSLVMELNSFDSMPVHFKIGLQEGSFWQFSRKARSGTKITRAASCEGKWFSDHNIPERK